MAETKEEENGKFEGNLGADTQIRFNETADQMVDEFRGMIEEVARNVGVRVRVYEYQVHEFAGPHEMMSRKHRRDFLKNDLLAALDPTPTQCACMVEGARINPLQRLTIAFSNPKDLYDTGRFLTGKKSPLFHAIDGDQQDFAQRAFPLHLSPNEDQRAQDSQQSKSIVERAVCYPAMPRRTDPKRAHYSVDRTHFTKLFVPKEV